MPYRKTFSPVTLAIRSPTTNAVPSSSTSTIVFFNGSARTKTLQNMNLSPDRQTHDRQTTQYSDNRVTAAH